MRPITSRSAFPSQTLTRQACTRASSTASSTTSSTCSMSLAHRGQRRPSVPTQAQLGHRHPGASKPADTTRVSTRRATSASRTGWRPATPDAARSHRLAQPVDHGRLPRPLDRGLHALGDLADLLGAGGGRQVDPAGDALPQVGVELPLQLGGDVVGPAQHQVVEPLLLVEGERGRRRVLDVPVSRRRGVAGDLVLAQLAAVVVVAGQEVELLLPVEQLPLLEQEQPGPLAIDDQDGEALVLGHDPPAPGHRASG